MMVRMVFCGWLNTEIILVPNMTRAFASRSGVLLCDCERVFMSVCG